MAAITLRSASSGSSRPLGDLLPGDRVDLAVLYRGDRHPQSRKGQGVTLLGRLLHVLPDLFLESQGYRLLIFFIFFKARFLAASVFFFFLTLGFS